MKLVYLQYFYCDTILQHSTIYRVNDASTQKSPLCKTLEEFGN